MRECLRDYANEIIKLYLEKNPDSNNSFNFNILENTYNTSSENCKFVPLISDFLILKYIPKYLPVLDKNLAVYFMVDFCNWLNRM